MSLHRTMFVADNPITYLDPYVYRYVINNYEEKYQAEKAKINWIGLAHIDESGCAGSIQVIAENGTLYDDGTVREGKGCYQKRNNGRLGRITKIKK